MLERDQTDQCFAQYCRTGDAQALGVVFDCTAPQLLQAAMWMTGERADAEDVVQRTFLQAITKRDQFEQGRRALPWLLGLLGNQARKQRDQRRSAATRPPAWATADRVANPHVEVATRELETALSDLGGALGEPYREVLRLHFEEELSAKEIAARLARPAGTVRTQLMRALALVRRRLPKGFDASRHSVPVLHGPAMAAARNAVIEAASAAAPAVALGSGVVATTSVAVTWSVSKLIIGLSIVVLGTGATWGTMSLGSGLGVNLTQTTAPTSADTVVAEDLTPSGDVELDEWRQLAVKAPLDELFKYALQFLAARIAFYPQDKILWRGVERLATEMVNNPTRHVREAEVFLVIAQVQGIAHPAEPSLRELLPQLRALREAVRRRR